MFPVFALVAGPSSPTRLSVESAALLGALAPVQTVQLAAHRSTVLSITQLGSRPVDRAVLAPAPLLPLQPAVRQPLEYLAARPGPAGAGPGVQGAGTSGLPNLGL